MSIVQNLQSSLKCHKHSHTKIWDRLNVNVIKEHGPIRRMCFFVVKALIFYLGDTPLVTKLTKQTWHLNGKHLVCQSRTLYIFVLQCNKQQTMDLCLAHYPPRLLIMILAAMFRIVWENPSNLRSMLSLVYGRQFFLWTYAM